MAFYAALASVVELLDDILLRNQYPNFLLGRRRIMKSLHNKFTLLLDSLQGFSSKGDEAADLERRIRDTAYQAQDAIESEIPEHTASESGEDNVFKKIFLLLVVACQNILCPHPRWVEFEGDLQKVGQEVDSILKAIKESQAREDLVVDYAAADVAAAVQKPTDSNTMVGFEEYLRKIQELLCGQSSQLQVIPIVGMGGIGKTTLARNAFDSAVIREKFTVRGWVAISQDYDVIRVLQNIVTSLGIMTMEELREWEKKKMEESEGKKEAMDDELEGEGEALDEREALMKKRKKKEEELEKRRKKRESDLKGCISQYLKGRPYLVVVDDVWSTENWDDLKPAFPTGKDGSRILLTTRLIQVAEHARTFDFVQEMQLLNTASSWKLLREKVFGKEPCPPELAYIGESIAGRCQGLPLALVIIAGILTTVRTREYWREIEGNVGSVLSKDDENLSNILSLSYNHLPHQLKACFLHMGSFPEDYEINISRLIKLWSAEGFLKSTSTSKSLERVGEEYLEDLVKRSLVMITKKSADGQFKSCVIHDLLRDFCKERGLHECFFHGKGLARHANPSEVENGKGQAEHANPSKVEKVRRIILGSTAPHMPWAYDDGKYVRSVCWFSKTTSSNVHSLEWGSVKLLRILDVADIETLVAPFAVSQMFHLKYLALQLATEKKKHLPPSIYMFQNLQTVIIYAPRCESITLPSEIWKMSQLRHLIIDRMILPPVFTVGDIPLQSLEYLQTLETVEDFIFTNEAISMIPNVKKLKLSCHEAEASGIWELHGLNNLVCLCQLEKLNIVFDATQFSNVDSFRSSFGFPKNLKKLSLEGCRLPWEELTVVGSLEYLQILRLREDALVGEEWEPAEGGFPKLKFLLMESLDLKCWKAEKTHFPCLEHLKINKCNKLEEIPNELGDSDTLILIEVYSSQHAGISANEILIEQRDLDNKVLQVFVRDW